MKKKCFFLVKMTSMPTGVIYIKELGALSLNFVVVVVVSYTSTTLVILNVYIIKTLFSFLYFFFCAKNDLDGNYV